MVKGIFVGETEVFLGEIRGEFLRTSIQFPSSFPLKTFKCLTLRDCGLKKIQYPCPQVVKLQIFLNIFCKLFNHCLRLGIY